MFQQKEDISCANEFMSFFFFQLHRSFAYLQNSAPSGNPGAPVRERLFSLSLRAHSPPQGESRARSELLPSDKAAQQYRPTSRLWVLLQGRASEIKVPDTHRVDELVFCACSLLVTRALTTLRARLT
jgi:hypothetical protein